MAAAWLDEVFLPEPMNIPALAPTAIRFYLFRSGWIHTVQKGAALLVVPPFLSRAFEPTFHFRILHRTLAQSVADLPAIVAGHATLDGAHGCAVHPRSTHLAGPVEPLTFAVAATFSDCAQPFLLSLCLVS